MVKSFRLMVDANNALNTQSLREELDLLEEAVVLSVELTTVIAEVSLLLLVHVKDVLMGSMLPPIGEDV